MNRLTPDTVDAEPVVQLRRWYDEAVAAGVRQPEAMTLATVRPDGNPAARTVLMRGLDQRGVSFYTNLESAKAADLSVHAQGALVLHWREQERQVRITGPVSQLPRDEAERYWANRPRGHRIGAWASQQSNVIEPGALDTRVAEIEVRFAGIDPPLPPFWGGYVVGIDELELWQGRTDRLHDRVRYRRTADGFAREQLAP